METHTKTIIDFAITKREWEQLIVGVPYTKENIKKYMQLTSPALKNIDLAYLFFYRKDFEQMKKFLQEVPCHQMRDSFWRTITHP